MTPIKTARRFGTTTFVLMLSVALTWFASFWLIDEWVKQPFWHGLMSILAFVMCGFLLFWVGFARLKSFKCPDCRTPLGKSPDKLGIKHRAPLATTAILFYCEKCDVVWDTGVRDNSDD